MSSPEPIKTILTRVMKQWQGEWHFPIKGGKMGAFKDLDIMMQDILGQDTEEYCRVKKEIHEHLNEDKPLESLSEAARHILDEWEKEQLQLRNRVTPLDQ